MRVAVGEETAEADDDLAARLRLLESFVSRTEIAEIAQVALQWLGEVTGANQSICLVRPPGEQSLFVLGAYGLLGRSSATSFTVSLEDWGNPLVNALTHRKQTFFPPHSAADRKRRPTTPFEMRRSTSPLGVSTFSRSRSTSLLGGSGTLKPSLHWFVTVFSQKLDQILRHEALTERDRG